MKFHSRMILLAAIFATWSFTSTAQASSQDAIGQFSEQGQRALAEGRYSDAEKAFEKLRELEPDVAEVHANLGAIYFQERKFRQAIPVLRRALQLKPSLSKTQTLLAMSLSETGQYEEAVAGLEKGFASSIDVATRRMCGLQLERVYSGLQRDAEAGSKWRCDSIVYIRMILRFCTHSGRIFGNYALPSLR